MRIVQVIKKLNNTELGKAGTHEYYVQVPQNLDVSDLLDTPEEVKGFIYKKTGKVYHIRLTVGREKRIVGLGDFYRDNNICAGDEIILERHITEDESSYFVDINRRHDILMIQKCKMGFELLNSDRKNLLDMTVRVYQNGVWQDIRLEYIGPYKKREDSPVSTDIYDVKVNGNSIASNYSGKEMVEIQVHQADGKALINRICAWKKYLFEMEEQDG